MISLLTYISFRQTVPLNECKRAEVEIGILKKYFDFFEQLAF